MKNLIFTAALLLAAIVKRLCAGGDFSTEAELKTNAQLTTNVS